MIGRELANARRWPTCLQNVTVMVSFTGDRLEQRIEVFQAGIFDDHASATVLVFNRNLQAKSSLQQITRLANVGIERRLLFFFTLRFFLRIEQSLDVTLCLAN